MKISVVICTRNRHETVEQAVASVAQCRFTDFDIHIMDQSTNDLTQKICDDLAARFSSKCPIVYHHLKKAGLSAAYNSGVGASTAPIIAFTDDDVIVPADWLSEIEDVFKNDPDVNLLYGQVLIPKELEKEVANGIIVPALAFTEYETLSLKGRFKVFGMGANMALRRSAMDLVQGFDEALGGGGPLRSSQDYDFAYRIYRFGGVIALAPKVKVDHYGTRTQEQWPDTMKNYGIGDGAFYAKHMRCGDRLAYWLFTKNLVISRLREIKRFFKSRKWQNDPYGRHLLVGYRESKAFDIDSKYRLYQETARGKMTETESNIVTSTRRSP